MIHNHEVPSSILGLATDLEAPAAVWLRALFFWVISIIRALLIDSFRRSGEVGQNGAGDGLTFGRWDEYGRRTVACGGWIDG